MRNGKRPTRAQKIKLKSLRLDPANWLIIKDCSECFEIVHRVSGKARTLDLREGYSVGRI